MVRLRAYKFRTYPTEDQEIFFAKSFGCARKIYNLMFNDRIKAYAEIENDSYKKCVSQPLQNMKKTFRS